MVVWLAGSSSPPLENGFCGLFAGSDSRCGGACFIGSPPNKIQFRVVLDGALLSRGGLELVLKFPGALGPPKERI